MLSFGLGLLLVVFVDKPRDVVQRDPVANPLKILGVLFPDSNFSVKFLLQFLQVKDDLVRGAAGP